MKIEFYKYHGTGNDFVIIDDRDSGIHLDQEAVAQLCHRRFGIGADGLMLLRTIEGYDFEMVYYNSDGKTSSMCGNGGRCLVAFAHHLGVVSNKARFKAIDGAHSAYIHPDKRVSLYMNQVDKLEQIGADWVLDTGSPHYLKFVDTNLMSSDSFISDAHQIRQSPDFRKDGINVNFIELSGTEHLKMRTFERGVENETYSCGTGAVAAAIGAHAQQRLPEGEFLRSIETPGGPLQVRFTYSEQTFSNVELIGPAQIVFNGYIEI